MKSSMTGDGITIYSNGDKYKGKFKAGVPDGFGIYYFHDHPSHRYEGQWVKVWIGILRDILYKWFFIFERK